MRLSLKHSPIGKPQAFDMAQVTYQWEAGDIPPFALVQHIESGKPFAVAQFKNGHRHSKNFIASSVLALDIDGINGRPLTQTEYNDLVLNNDFVVNHAFAVIQSSSSRDGAYKCRVLFRLDQTITDPQEYEQLARALIAKMPLSDPQCKDAARFFYGGQAGRKADFMALDNLIGVADLRQQIAVLEAAKTVKKANRSDFKPSINPDHNKRYLEAVIQNVEDKCNYAAKGEGNQALFLAALNLMGFVKGGYLTYAEAESLLMATDAAMRRSQHEAVSAIKSGYNLAESKIIPDKQHTTPLDLRHLLDIPPDSPTTAINARFLNEAVGVLDNPVIAVKSPIGTGKTEWSNKQLQGQSFIEISHRCSLIANTAERRNTAGLMVEVYNNIDTKKYGVPSRFTTTSNSLHKLLNNGNLPAFDVVVLDEIEQGLAHLMGDTFNGGEGHLAFNLLLATCRQAKQVIAMDADLGPIALAFLKLARPDDTPYIIHNTYTMQRGPMAIYDSPDHALQLALDAVERGERIAIACDSKERALAVDTLFQSRNIKKFCITGDNSDHTDAQAFLADITPQVNNIQAFIYTSSLGTGVDIQADIDTVFGLFDNRSITPQEQLQLIGRCRRAKAWVIGSKPIQGSKPTDEQAIKADYLARPDLLAKAGVVMEVNGSQWGLSPSQDNYLTFLCLIEASRNASLNNARDLFIELAKREYSVSLKIAKNDKAVSEELKAAKQANHAAHKQAVLEALPVSEEVYKAAKERGKGSKELDAGYEHGAIEDFYKQPITSAIYDHAKNRGMSQLAHFINFYRPDERLRALDRTELDLPTDLHKLSLTTPKMLCLRAIMGAVYPDGLHSTPITIDTVKAALPDVLTAWEQHQGRLLFGRGIQAKKPLGILQAAFEKIGLTFSQGKVGRERVYLLQGLDLMQGYALARLNGLDRVKYEPEITAINGAGAGFSNYIPNKQMLNVAPNEDYSAILDAIGF